MIPIQTLSIHNHQPTLWKKSKAIYLVTLTLVVSAIGSLPFIKTTISIKSTGIIRPQTERTDIKPSIGGILESILIKEGDFIQKGQLLAVIEDRTTTPKIILNHYEQKQRQDFIADLTKLTGKEIIEPSALQTPLYRLELSRFLAQFAEKEDDINKLKKEL
nr:biotin/lipoyl-binding protein [uncultured Sediminibacterium sp.]